MEPTRAIRSIYPQGLWMDIAVMANAYGVSRARLNAALAAVGLETVRAREAAGDPLPIAELAASLADRPGRVSA